MADTNYKDILPKDEALQPLVDAVEQIMTMPEENLTEETVEVINGMIRGGITDKIRKDSVEELIRGFEKEGFTKDEVIDNLTASKQMLQDAIDDLQPSPLKKKILDNMFSALYEIFDEAAEHFGYDIVLPIKLDKDAVMPEYAHETDACADLSALEKTVVPAHSIGNKIKTGIHLQLPSGWQARLAPRSSIGANTPLRLSNSMGIIDTGYTGDVTVLFDNISDSDYTINAGDRIAQLWVEPIYRFKPQKVDILKATERNDGGFGSTGK